MVAAICITGIFIYFFVWSQKVKKEQEKEWIQFGKEDEVEVLIGILTYHLIQKKKFNDRYWYVELEGTIYSEPEHRKQKIVWRKPIAPSLEIPHLEKNQKVALYGSLRSSYFYVNRIEINE
jgi:hypothetical protein